MIESLLDLWVEQSTTVVSSIYPPVPPVLVTRTGLIIRDEFRIHRAFSINKFS